MQTQDRDTANTKADQPAVSARTATLRRVLVPVARFYSGVDIAPEDDAQQAPTLTINERAILADAARKFAAEGDVLLRTWRLNGEFSFDKSSVQRDAETGAWPEPSLGLVAELVASIEALRTGALPLAQQQQAEEREQARIALETKRLELESRRLEIMQDQIKRGIRRPIDPGLSYKVESAGGQKSGISSSPAIKAAMSTNQDMAGLTMIRSVDQPIQGAAGSGDAIQECLRVALCDLLLCFLDLICHNGTLDWGLFGLGSNVPSNNYNQVVEAQNYSYQLTSLAERFLDCLGIFLCTFLSCYVNQLCPQDQSDCVQLTGRCDFAVEEMC